MRTILVSKSDLVSIFLPNELNDLKIVNEHFYEFKKVGIKTVPLFFKENSFILANKPAKAALFISFMLLYNYDKTKNHCKSSLLKKFLDEFFIYLQRLK